MASLLTWLDWEERARWHCNMDWFTGTAFHLLQEGYDPEFCDDPSRLCSESLKTLMRHWIENGLGCEYDFLARKCGSSQTRLGSKPEVPSTRLLISASTAGNAVVSYNLP